jgi:hypothetical protein
MDVTQGLRIAHWALCSETIFIHTAAVLKNAVTLTENTMRIYYNDHPVNVLAKQQLFIVKIDTKYINCPSKMSRF